MHTHKCTHSVIEYTITYYTHIINVLINIPVLSWWSWRFRCCRCCVLFNRCSFSASNRRKTGPPNRCKATALAMARASFQGVFSAKKTEETSRESWGSITYYTGWWFQPLWKILVNGKDYSIPWIMENKKKQTTNQYKNPIWIFD